MKKWFVYFIILVCLIPVVYSVNYWDYLTKAYADRLYCAIGGSCNMTELTVGNLTVHDQLFNVSVVDYNVSKNIFVNGNITVGGNIFGTINWSWIQNIPSGIINHNPFNQSLNTTDDVRFHDVMIDGVLRVDREDEGDNANIVVNSDSNMWSCINLTDGGALGFSICSDGASDNWLRVMDQRQHYDYFYVDRDNNNTYFKFNVNVSTNLTANRYCNTTNCYTLTEIMNSTLGSGAADNLGNHTATTNLNLTSHNLTETNYFCNAQGQCYNMWTSDPDTYNSYLNIR